MIYPYDIDCEYPDDIWHYCDLWFNNEYVPYLIDYETGNSDNCNRA